MSREIVTSERERGETVELPLTIAALRYRCRAAISSAEGPQQSVLTQRPNRTASNASPAFRRRRSQDHVAFLVSCHALQTERPR